ncbi:shadow of prion protein-like [Carassius auratus]|uniref:Shadow of prion protein-like n=1 Tax=Carassius auratus TaxID=7957 RepID=A0A6P6QA64_CARAU|nr:shadow of prion protein-like [Carassius auratus]
MMGNQKVLIIWVWMLLLASLYPWANCRRGGGFGGRGKGVGVPAKAPPSQSKGRQGLKLAGAAAAGALGGAVIGYGLGSLGRPRYGYGYDGSSEDDRRYYPDGQGYYNRSDWRYYRNTGSTDHVTSVLIILGTVTHIFIWG